MVLKVKRGGRKHCIVKGEERREVDLTRTSERKGEGEWFFSERNDIKSSLVSLILDDE